MDLFGYGLGVVAWVTLTLGFLAVYIVVGVFFLLNLRDLLRQVSPQNRAMQPDQVWLNFIPLFNLVWMFITVIRVRDSVQAEFRTRGWGPQGDFGFGVGLAAAILSIVSWGPLGLAALICWIIYWVRMSELKNQLIVAQPPVGRAPAPPHPGQWGAVEQGRWRSCASCGTPIGPGDAFCRRCGARADVITGAEQGAASTAPDVSEAAAGTCPFCGAVYRPNAQFCRSCGRPVV